MIKALMLALVMLTAIPARADEDKVTVPRSMLTQEQVKKLDEQNPAGKWVGLGKEVGDAVNSSLQAITTQTSNFSQTKVGKLTMFLVVWKMLGDMIVHLTVGLLMLLIFVPLWIWSYRKTCITRSIKTGKDTYEKIEYNPNKYGGDITPRVGHAIALIAFAICFFLTVFTY
jgi:hypothetical protein